MRKLLIWLVNIICPGIIFLINEQYFKMSVAFALQVSILGWIPAIIWARSAWAKKLKKEKAKKQSKPPSTPQASIPTSTIISVKNVDVSSDSKTTASKTGEST